MHPVQQCCHPHCTRDHTEGLIQPPSTREQPTLLGQGLSFLPPLTSRWETMCLWLNATWETWDWGDQPLPRQHSSQSCPHISSGLLPQESRQFQPPGAAGGFETLENVPQGTASGARTWWRGFKTAAAQPLAPKATVRSLEGKSHSFSIHPSSFLFSFLTLGPPGSAEEQRPCARHPHHAHLSLRPSVPLSIREGV